MGPLIVLEWSTVSVLMLCLFFFEELLISFKEIRNICIKFTFVKFRNIQNICLYNVYLAPQAVDWVDEIPAATDKSR